MKKYYKVLSVAVAGAIAAQSAPMIPVSAAEETVVEVDATSNAETDSDETANNVDSSEQELTDDQTSSENQELNESSDELDETETEEASETEETSEKVETSETEELSEAEESVETQEAETESAEAAEEIDWDNLELIEPTDDEDFNEDGISDLMTKRLCDGEILTEDGEKVFGDLTYVDVQKTDDLDGDGLLNGDEVEIKTAENGTEYAALLSDPCKLDTDDDGIYDADDTAPWEYGLAGGVVGNVRLVARHDESTGNPTHGHVYIVYTSYVNNLEITIENLYGYYVTNEEYKQQLDEACDSEGASIVSWRSTVDEVTDANEDDRLAAAADMYQDQEIEQHTSGTVILNRGDYISIGNYGMAETEDVVASHVEYAKEILADDYEAIAELWSAVTGESVDADYVMEHYEEIMAMLGTDSSIIADHVVNSQTPGGVWINRELYNQKLGYDQGPNQVIEQDATNEQLSYMLDLFAEESYFNFFTHNCSTVGADVWNALYGYTTDENGETVESDYYVESGITVSVSTADGEVDTTFNFPAIVKASIATKSDLAGYIGNMTYVTGKKLVNTINEVVKTFDITKLFRAKTTDTAEESQEAGTGESKSQGSNSTSETSASSSSSSTASQTTSSSSIYVTAATVATGDEVLATIFDTDTPLAADENVATTGMSRANTRTVEATDDNDGEDVELEQQDVAEENEELTSIEDDETPLAGETEKTNVVMWIWIIAAIVLAIASVMTRFVLKKKQKK